MTSPSLKAKYNFSENYYSVHASKKLGNFLKTSNSKITEEYLRNSQSGNNHKYNLLKCVSPNELKTSEIGNNSNMLKINERGLSKNIFKRNVSKKNLGKNISFKCNYS
jgi:hypothetical protein